MAKDKSKAVPHDPPPAALLHRARGFLRVANNSYTEYCNPQSDFPTDLLARPLNFLYSMSAELVLKAFILSRKEPIEGTTLKTHNLIELYAKCQQLGLKFCADETRENKNVMMYLHRGNENQGFRYFSTSSVEPDVRWSHDVVNRIVQIIGEELRPLDVEDLVPVRLVFIMEGPRPKDA